MDAEQIAMVQGWITDAVKAAFQGELDQDALMLAIDVRMVRPLAQRDAKIAELEALVKHLNNEIGTLVVEVRALRIDVDNSAEEEHYHDEYASVDHVERSEGQFQRDIYNLQNNLDNLGYRVDGVERKAERAQSAAESAQRSSGGRYW